MPASTFKILSTKQLPQAALADAVAKGADIECIPFIKITYRRPDEIAAKLVQATPEDVFIFTSQHAIAAACDQLASYHNDAYCISGSTKAALNTFTKMKLAGVASNASLLCESMRLDSDRAYIFCCSNKRLDIIPDYLRAHGIPCNEVICYDTEQRTTRVDTIYDAVLFFSPSAADSYFTSNRPYAHQHFYCIGNTTAATVKKYTSQNVFIADEPSVVSLLSQIEQIRNS